MKLPSNILDIRGYSPEKAISELKCCSDCIDKKGCMWLINDIEPIHCYKYLMEHDYHFQTFIVSKNEYRVFISRA